MSTVPGAVVTPGRPNDLPADDAPGAGQLARAVLSYARELRRYYPVDAGPDPLALGVHQVANVLEQKASTMSSVAFRLWLTQYAQALFWAHPDRGDTYSLGISSVAGDLEVALLAWGDPDGPADTFQEIAADVFGILGAPADDTAR